MELMSNTECHGWELIQGSFTGCWEIVSPGEEEYTLEDRRSTSGNNKVSLVTGKNEWSRVTVQGSEP